jgi:hypothetical protein
MKVTTSQNHNESNFVAQIFVNKKNERMKIEPSSVVTTTTRSQIYVRFPFVPPFLAKRNGELNLDHEIVDVKKVKTRRSRPSRYFSFFTQIH